MLWYGCYVMLCYVILYHVTLCYVMSCYVMSCYVVLCYEMLFLNSHCEHLTVMFCCATHPLISLYLSISLSYFLSIYSPFWLSLFFALFHVTSCTISFSFKSMLIFFFFLIKFNCSWRLGRMQCHAVSDGSAVPSLNKYQLEATLLKLNSPPHHRQCHCLWRTLLLPRLGCLSHALLPFSALGWVRVCLSWHALIEISNL